MMKSIVKSIMLCIVAAPLFFVSCQSVETKDYIYGLNNPYHTSGGTHDGVPSGSAQAVSYIEGIVDVDEKKIVRAATSVDAADAEAKAWFDEILSKIDDDKVNSYFSEGTDEYYTLSLWRGGAGSSDSSVYIASKTWPTEE